jgi:hypothetical protein
VGLGVRAREDDCLMSISVLPRDVCISISVSLLRRAGGGEGGLGGRARSKPRFSCQQELVRLRKKLSTVINVSVVSNNLLVDGRCADGWRRR